MMRCVLRITSVGSRASPNIRRPCLCVVARSFSKGRPSIDDVERLSRGEGAKRRGVGSREVPHRLNADERVQFDLAKKRCACTAVCPYACAVDVPIIHHTIPSHPIPSGVFSQSRALHTDVRLCCARFAACTITVRVTTTSLCHSKHRRA